VGSAILERVDSLAEALASEDTQHFNLMVALYQLVGELPGIEQDPALHGIAVLGRWPQDVSEDTLLDLESDPQNQSLLGLYAAYLEMAGVDREAAEAELTLVSGGLAIASKKRIKQLLSEHPFAP
jgi:hypothetical protein